MCGENHQKLINKRDLEFILLDLICVSLPDAKECPSSYRRCKLDKSLRKIVPVGSYGRDKLGLMVVYPNILG